MNEQQPQQITELLKSLAAAIFSQAKGSRKGFIGSLFDISFSSFITTKLVSVLYILAILSVIISTIYIIVMGFDDSAGQGFMMLIVAPIGGLIALAINRVILEITVVVFRIAESLQSVDSKIAPREVE